MKSEKVGVLIYYKHLEILEEAQLSDEQIGVVLKAAIRYDETGEVTPIASPLSAFFTMIKYDIDANRKKWEAIKEERREFGKMGGRPKKAKKPNGNDESKKTNSFMNEQIKGEAKTNGFFIDDETAKSFGNCGLDPEWLVGPHSFLELAAERVLEKEKYRELPFGEQKALFNSAVRNWKELRDEYPEWKKRKIDEEEAAEREAALEAARYKHPKICDKCSCELVEYEGKYHCKKCSLVCELDKKTIEWKWRDW